MWPANVCENSEASLFNLGLLIQEIVRLDVYGVEFVSKYIMSL